MTDIIVLASGSCSLVNTTLSKLTGMSLSEAYPTGAPSPWHNGNQQVQCITGAAGVYELGATIQTNGTSGSFYGQFRVNGTDIASFGRITSPSTGGILSGTRHVRLAVGDYVELWASQTAGITASIDIREFWARWVWS
jgi:hypothetical protein